MTERIYDNINEETETLIPITYWVKITLQKEHGGEYLQFLYWELPNLKLRMKYNWYFKYRAALLQVQHPKFIVEIIWGSFKTVSEEEEKQIDLRNKIIGKKRTLTKWKNILKEVEESWDQLWPITEYPNYVKAKQKVQQLEIEVEQLIYTQ